MLTLRRHTSAVTNVDLNEEQEPRTVGGLRFRVYEQPLLRSARRALERARRLVDRRPLVYISAQSPLGQIFPDLLASLRAAGLRPSGRRIRGYLRIEDEIDRSDAVVAVISHGSLSSSRQMSELSFGCGLPGATRRVATRLRPVFIFPATEDLVGYLDSLERAPAPPVRVEPAPQTAAARVAETLKAQRL
jgi:hypothetical protein